MIPMHNVVNYRSYLACVQDLLDTPEVRSMKQIPHHPGTSCYEHSVFVSYVAFRLAGRGSSTTCISTTRETSPITTATSALPIRWPL